MANRRMGGPPQRGRFSQQHHHQPFQGNVSPWQGNANNSMSQQQGLLSNPQQLALALTSLLQPQANNPPSLLSMNTLPGGSSYNRQDNRLGIRGRDFRRHEPYLKNRGQNGNNGNNPNWRNLDQRRRQNHNQPNYNNKERKSAPKGGGGQKKPDNNKATNKKPPAEEKKPEEEATEEDTDTKRDWKAEKNTSEEQQPTEDLDANNKEGDSNKDGRYQGVPQKLLNCFVCNKEMWDGESMQKHVRGRAHKQMLSSLEESIHCTVKILRENMRVQEERKHIEMNRVHRLKKFNRFQDVESHCNMCDLKFLGKILAHRKTEGHQRLKRYLHPNCTICEKEFPSRMEWVEHRLTPEHLRALNASLEKKGDGDVVIREEELDLEPLLDEPLQLESEHPILEFQDDMSAFQNLMPAYKKERAVSTKSLVEFTGFACEICSRSFVSKEMAQAHLRTRRHYYAFIDAAKKRYKKAVEDKKKEEEAETIKVEDGEEEKPQDIYDPEEACKEEEEQPIKKVEPDTKDINGGDEQEPDEDFVLMVEKDEPMDEDEAAVEVKTETPGRPVRRAAAAAAAAVASPNKKTRK